MELLTVTREEPDVSRPATPAVTSLFKLHECSPLPLAFSNPNLFLHQKSTFNPQFSHRLLFTVTSARTHFSFSLFFLNDAKFRPRHILEAVFAAPHAGNSFPRLPAGDQVTKHNTSFTRGFFLLLKSN